MNRPDNILPQGIYGITAEEYSKGRKNIEVVREMARGGIKIIQYREKGGKSLRQKYDECREIRKITADEGILFIVNDFIDIALAVGADGVHIGQDDLPVKEVRALIGNKIIGLSTHSPEQAQKALLEGADYIGVGPIFKTYTKKHGSKPVGLSYLDFVVENIPLPFVAIGGIKERNILEVVKRGAKTIALVTEITGSADIPGKLKKLAQLME